MSEARGFRAIRQRCRSRGPGAPATDVSPPPQQADDQGAEWSDFIEKELEREYTRRDTVNTRAAGAIASATTLITVTLAVLGVAKGAHYVIDGLLLQSLLAAALLFLLLAAVSSIVAGAVGGGFRVASENDMRSMLSAERWPAHTIDARYHTADLNITAIMTLRSGTSTKYRYLVTAHVLQAGGVFLLALFALKVIFD